MLNGNGWKCGCKDYSVASLRLEMRSRTPSGPKSRFILRMLLLRELEELEEQVLWWLAGS